jgi:sulfoxide reductase heme-binding subunit YedZ
MMNFDIAPLCNYLGFLALIFYVLTLLPSILRVVFPQTKQTGIPKYLLQQRRLTGLIAFVLACAHGYLLAQKRNIDLLDLKTSWIYIQGVSTFTIFTILAVTSND